MKKNSALYLIIIMLALSCVYLLVGRTSDTEVTVTDLPDGTVIATPTPTPTPTASPMPTPTPTPTPAIAQEKNKYGPITVEALFGTSKKSSVVPSATSEIVGTVTQNEIVSSDEKENENSEYITVQDLFGKKGLEPSATPELEVYTNIVSTSEEKTLNPFNFAANTNEDGFQLCTVLLNNDGYMIAVENGYELGTRKMTLTSLEEGHYRISKVVVPKDNASDRLNGRFVRSKKPHEVIVNNGVITAGFSQVPLKLEVVDARLLEELLGKPASEVTAQEIVTSTIVVENHDGKWIAAHKAAPGYRGPLVAKLHLENGRWLRVEKWNWTINAGDPKSKGIPSLVLVMCSDRGARTPI